MAARRHGTTALNEGFDQEVIDAVWAKGRPISGYSSDKYRADICGAVMEKSKHGDTTPDGYGWEIDHIRPVAKGGADGLDNLQPLQWENNRAKSDNDPGKWSCAMPRR